MKRNLVDPVHFFDSSGVSMLSGKHLQARCDDQEREIARLRDIIRRLQIRMKQREPDQTKPINN